MQFSVESTIGRVGAEFAETTAKQLRFATVRALNAIGTRAGQAIEKRIAAEFDRPTRYAQRSTFVQYVDRRDKAARLEVAVQFKGEQVSDARGRSTGRFTRGDDTPPYKFLGPHVFGVPRRAKGFELRLRAAGIMAADEWAVIAEGYPTDAFGNLSQQLLTRMLSQVQAFTLAGFDANATGSRRSRAKRARRQFFVATGRDRLAMRDDRGRFNRQGSRAATAGAGLPRGIYEAQQTAFGKAVRAVLLFVKRRPTYRARLPFGPIVEAQVAQHFEATLRAELQRALATARPEA